MTQRLPVVSILSVLLLSALACASSQTSRQDDVAISMLQGSRVVVTPLNLGIRRAASLDQKSGAVAHELIDFLHMQGAEVSALSHEDATELWAEAFAANSSRTDLDAAVRDFARRVAAEGEFDVLVMPSLLIRGARVDGDQANWDGVRREIETSSPVADPRQETGYSLVSMRGLEGQVAAASLHVVMLSREGRQIFEGIAGLDLMQKAQLAGTDSAPEWKLKAREEPLRDLDNVREGIEMAFERRLPKTARSW